MKYYHIFLTSGQELIVGSDSPTLATQSDSSNVESNILPPIGEWLRADKLFQVMNGMSPQGVVKIKTVLDTKKYNFMLRSSAISVIREVEKDEEEELNKEGEDKPNILIPRRN